jgi:hypothetical protein
LLSDNEAGEASSSEPELVVFAGGDMNPEAAESLRDADVVNEDEAEEDAEPTEPAEPAR